VTRLADLLTGLSRTADLGFGLPQGEAVRSASLAVLLGRSLDLTDEEVQAGMYAGLLLHLGCIGFAHETAAVFGDELAMNAAISRVNTADFKEVATSFVPAIARGRSPLGQARLVVTALTRGPRFGRAYETAACEVGHDAARRLRLPEQVALAVQRSYERWDGSGVPDGLAGEDIPIGARLAALATVATILDEADGAEAAAEGVRRQAGTILDPGLADHLGRRAGELLGELAARDPHEHLLELEPEPVAHVAPGRLAEVAAVFGDIVDLKTPYTHGHARGVAALAVAAGEGLGLGGDDLEDLRVAALLHDVGRVGVPTSIWEKPGPLSVHEWEQVRLHPYFSERILAGAGGLASLAPLVGAHHERLDGQGYHRGSPAQQLDLRARVLAAADVYRAMREARPHRPALTPDDAERELLTDVRAGRLDPDAATAVLAAAGHAAVATREPPAGLSPREVEVLALVAEGCTNRQIAERLVISKRTAEHHVQHVYSKIGVTSRPAAALFAIQHDLLVPTGGSGRGAG
jgi:HD-GYP domain-containing protein (c-di-GMP phosphodiesterase class II)